jgi:hypothetical protein
MIEVIRTSSQLGCKFQIVKSRTEVSFRKTPSINNMDRTYLQLASIGAVMQLQSLQTQKEA